MSQNTQPTGSARTVNAVDRGGLDIKSLVLLAVLLAAGFILNFTVGKAISAVSGGAIAPEFIISAAVIQVTTTSPGIDFVAEGVAAVVMALIVNAGMSTGAKAIIPTVGTFVTTFLSGFIFMVIKMAMMGFATELAAVMMPVIALTAVFNAILVGALCLPVRKALGLND